jgi:argininosuccinate lyase
MSLLWGGRFREPGRRVLWDFTVSPVDHRLLPYDLRGSIAHVRMLSQIALLSVEDEKNLLVGLEKLQTEASEGRFEFLESDEDVHSAVERRLKEILGDVAGNSTPDVREMIKSFSISASICSIPYSSAQIN